MSQIDVATARGLTAYWEQIRGNNEAVLDIFQPYHYFHLDDLFNWSEFVEPGVIARGYLGYVDPQGGGYGPENLRLMFINAEQDKQLAEGNISEPYIYSASYTYSGNEVPAPVEGDAKVARWAQGYEQWCDSVNPSGGQVGMTRVFDIPLFDLLKQVEVGTGKNLQVYFGLRLPSQNPQFDIDLITYHPETEEVLHFLSVDDFTSPKPPFGSQAAEATYGLIN